MSLTTKKFQLTSSDLQFKKIGNSLQLKQTENNILKFQNGEKPKIGSLQLNTQKLQVIQNKDVDTERKKASQILHYLMERKQEVDFSDPFELLRNMNDVLYNYGEQIMPESTNLNSIERPEKENLQINSQELNEDYFESGNQGKIHKQNSNKISRVMLQTGRLSHGHSAAIKTQQNQLNTTYGGGGSSFYSNNPKSSSKKFGYKYESSTIQNDSTENNSIIDRDGGGSLDISSFPEIINKTAKFNELKNDSIQKSARVRHILDKQKERILNTNIPEVNQMYDGLDQKYNRILKLKEEFQDIKSQFSIPITSHKKSSQQSLNSSTFLQTQDNLIKIDKKLGDNLLDQSIIEENSENGNQSKFEMQSRTQSQPKQRLQRLIHKQQVQLSAQYQQSIAAANSFKINVFNHTSRSLEKNDQSQQKREKILQNQRAILALKLTQLGGSGTGFGIELKNSQLTLNKKFHSEIQEDSHTSFSAPNQNQNQQSRGVLNQLSFRKQMSLQEQIQQQQLNQDLKIIDEAQPIMGGRKFVKSQLISGSLNTSGQGNNIQLQLFQGEKFNNKAIQRLNKLYPNTRALIEHSSPINDRFKNSEKKQTIEVQKEVSDLQLVSFEQQAKKLDLNSNDYFAEFQMSRQQNNQEINLSQLNTDRKKDRENQLKQIYGEDPRVLESFRKGYEPVKILDISPQKNVQVKQVDQQQQHAGIALYEKFILEQQKQIKLIKKQQKKLKKQKLKEESKQHLNSSVENIYMRETIGSAGRNLATSQGSGYFQKGNYFLHKKQSQAYKKSKNTSRCISQISKRRSQSLGMNSKENLNDHEPQINEVQQIEVQNITFENVPVEHKQDKSMLSPIEMPLNSQIYLENQEEQDPRNLINIQPPLVLPSSNFEKLQEMKKQIELIKQQNAATSSSKVINNQKTSLNYQFKLKQNEEPQEETDQIELLMLNSSIFQLGGQFNDDTQNQEQNQDQSNLDFDQDIHSGQIELQ
eukprot:403371100